MRSPLIAAILLLAAPLLAQSYSNGAMFEPANPYGPGNIETPQYHLGSGDQPAVVTIPPVVVEESELPSYEPAVDNVPPASTALLATRHFDFIVSPVQKIVAGSMEDTSISLGDYARQLRAEKPHAPTPNAMSLPLNEPNPAPCP